MPDEKPKQNTSRPEPDPQSQLDRRRFLKTGGSAAAVLLAAGSSQSCGSSDRPHRPFPPGSPTPDPPIDCKPDYFEALAEPPVRPSRDGKLVTSLRMAQTEVTIRETGDVRRELLRTYDGMIPGPTLSIRPGDEILLDLVNDLPPNPKPSDPNCPPRDPDEGDCSGHGHGQVNTPHCFNTTNLHTHGLHVTPCGNSDNVFLEVKPLTTQDYHFKIPENHPPGTHWYHPHKHGSTDLQVRNGLAGAIIIEEQGDQRILPEALQRVLILQEIQNVEAQVRRQIRAIQGTRGFAGVPPQELFRSALDDVSLTPNKFRQKFTVNGRVIPTLRLRPGEIQRWRTINATVSVQGYAELELVPLDRPQERLPLNVVAYDGFTLPRMRENPTVLLAPGNRVDLLVQFAQPGRYCLNKLPRRRANALTPGEVLAHVEVVGPPRPMQLPGSLPPAPPFLQPIRKSDLTRPGVARTLRFDVTPGTGTTRGAARFIIDGKSYCPTTIHQQIELGAVEEWRIENLSPAEHPFHIHVNPFQVVRINGREVPLEERFFQDVVNIPPTRNFISKGSVHIRSRFINFPGDYVLHCHILAHEDRGMMQNVRVGQPCPKGLSEEG